MAAIGVAVLMPESPVAGPPESRPEDRVSRAPAPHVPVVAIETPVEGTPSMLPPPQVVAERWLDARHVVLILDTTPGRRAALAQAVPESSAWLKRWQAGLAQGRPDWVARSSLMKAGEQWAEDIRLRAGEATLVNGWELGEDRRGLPPANLAWISLDERDPAEGLGRIAYAICAYLTLPEGVASHQSEIRHASGIHHRLDFDAQRTVSWAIKINQVGYRPADHPKIARFGAWIPGQGPLPCAGETFEVVDEANGEVVLSGSPYMIDDAGRCTAGDKADPAAVRPLLTGERVYGMDFSAVQREGMYRIRMAGTGVSWPFRIGDDAYDGAFVTSMRGLFHQRASFALTSDHTSWTRPRHHRQPVYRGRYLAFGSGYVPWPKNIDRFDVIGAERLDIGHVEDLVGGWYDAADYDRNFSHYVNILDLLWVFERRPEVFPDGQLTIPESGNGIPDILDEVEYGLRVWLLAQDADGGVPGMVETSTHPAIDDDRLPWVLSRPTSWSTLLFAGSAAKFSLCVRPFSPELADTYAAASRRAFHAVKEEKVRIGAVSLQARRQRGKGEEYEITYTEPASQDLPFHIFAATQMARLDNDDRFLVDMAERIQKCEPPYRWPCTFRDYSPYLYRDLLDRRDILDAETRKTVISWFVDPAREILAAADEQPYGQTWPRSKDFWMGWGETIFANRNRCLILARDLLTEQAEVDRAILANIGHDFGANPMGLSWTTGIGSVYPVAIQHEWSSRDGIRDPMPGLTIYGVTGGIFKQMKEEVWSISGKDGSPRRFQAWDDIPLFRRWSAHPSLNTASCEFTIHETMSATALTCAWLQSGTTPPVRIPNEEVPGYWYLP